MRGRAPGRERSSLLWLHRPSGPPLSTKMFQPGPGFPTPAQCCLSFAAKSEPNPDSPGRGKALVLARVRSDEIFGPQGTGAIPGED
jgi:hypothetical protein